MVYMFCAGEKGDVLKALTDIFKENQEKKNEGGVDVFQIIGRWRYHKVLDE
jgi:hypothetical protein